ncbi:MAG: 2-oxoacid:acceptor oxidoreductase family protein [Oscillospiraceae bacterium]
MNSLNIIFAGFGGQGILFSGKIVAYSGLIDKKEVSWLPSYGPEMRGGTANCSVCVSENPIGSPLIINPDVLIAMNNPSYDKFISEVVKDGIAIIDSTLVDRKCNREDVKAYYIPATKMAEDNNLHGLANMIILGKVLKETSFASFETVKKAISKCVPAKKQHLLEPNLKAVELGYNF